VPAPDFKSGEAGFKPAGIPREQIEGFSPGGCGADEWEKALTPGLKPGIALQEIHAGLKARFPGLKVRGWHPEPEFFRSLFSPNIIRTNHCGLYSEVRISLNFRGRMKR
jgi:hypothetical protein